MQIARWGNSLAVRLPASLTRELGLKEGDEIELLPAEGGFRVARPATAEEILAGLRRFSGRLPADATFSRDEANARD